MSETWSHGADWALILADEAYARSLGIDVESVLRDEWAQRMKYVPGWLIPPRPTLDQLRAVLK